MAGGDASGTRPGVEIERHDDVRSRGDDRRSRRTFAADSGPTGSQRRIYGVYLLDVSAAAHSAESEASHWRLRIFANPGAGPDFPGQHRQHSKLVGHARPGHWPDRAKIR